MLAMYKGDNLLAIGTRYELAKQFSVKLSTIDWYRHTAGKRQSGNKRYVIKLEDE
jgi:hypothetical protein